MHQVSADKEKGAWLSGRLGASLVVASSDSETCEAFFLYLSKNTIEFDVLRVTFFATMKEDSADMQYLRENSSFGFLNPNLLRKLEFNRFIVHNRQYYELTLKGFKAVLCLIGSIVKPLREKSYSAMKLSTRLLDDGCFLGGFRREVPVHTKLIESLLKSLTELGFLKRQGLLYRLSDSENRDEVCFRLVKKLIENGYFKVKRELNDLIAFLKGSLPLKDFSLAWLMKRTDTETQERIRKLLSRFDPREYPLQATIRKLATETIDKKDWLAGAAYWQLEAKLHEEKEWADFCESRGFISLAIYCKRSGDLLEKAAEYYGKAAEIMSEYPRYRKKAALQRANALQCEARTLARKDEFEQASISYLQGAKIFDDLGMEKESVFCKYRNLQNRAKESATLGEFLVAAEMMQTAATYIKPYAEKYYHWGVAEFHMYRREHLRKNDDLLAAGAAGREAATSFRKAGQEKFYFRNLGLALQTEAFALRSSGASYVEIAEKFKSAANVFEQASDFVAATVAQADSLKNYGLDAKNKGEWNRVIEHFQQGWMLHRNLAYSCESPEARANHVAGGQWFEAIKTETMAAQKLLELIPKREKLDEVTKMLMHAADIFSRLGDKKHAEIDSTFVMIVMAIDAFHRGDVSQANGLLLDAKSRLPPDFVVSMLESEVKPKWEPLRYTIEMLTAFSKYGRKIETEKGFSAESRVRELLRKLYSECSSIESQVFIPEDDEIGVVFDNKTPIEIDAIGTHKKNDRIHVLVAEIKNISDPVKEEEVEKFLKKLRFLEIRYGKLSRLQSLKKPLIAQRLFVSFSGFASSARSLAQRNKIEMFEKKDITTLMRKNGVFPIP